jgi:hypothetical protein
MGDMPSGRSKILATSASVLVLSAAATVAQEGNTLVVRGEAGDELIVSFGGLTKNSDGASQMLSVKNRSLTKLVNVEVGCSFYAGGKQIGYGAASIRDLKPGSSSQNSIISTDGKDADSVRCRIKFE